MQKCNKLDNISAKKVGESKAVKIIGVNIYRVIIKC